MPSRPDSRPSEPSRPDSRPRTLAPSLEDRDGHLQRPNCSRGMHHQRVSRIQMTDFSLPGVPRHQSSPVPVSPSFGPARQHNQTHISDKMFAHSGKMFPSDSVFFGRRAPEFGLHYLQTYSTTYMGACVLQCQLELFVPVGILPGLGRVNCSVFDAS